MRLRFEMKLPICTLFALLALVACNSFAAGPAEARGTLRGLSWSGEITDLLIESKGNLTPIHFNPNAPSEKYSFALDKPLIFYRMVADAEGKQIPQEVTRIESPGKISGAILVLLLPDAAAGSYSAFAMPEDTTSFPVGSYRFANFSEEKLAILFSGSQLILDPHKTHLLIPEDKAEAATIDIQLYGQREEKAMRLYSNLWGFKSDVRTLVLIAPLPNNPGRITVRRVPERIFKSVPPEQ